MGQNKDIVLELRDLWNEMLLGGNAEICTDRLKDCGIIDVKILKVIYNNLSINVKAIAEILKIPNSTLTNAINRLTKKGLLERKLNQADLRSFEIALTEEGRLAVEEHLEKEKKLFEELLTCLSNQEKDNLLAIITKLKDGLKDAKKEQ